MPTMLENAQRLGGHRWVCLAAFELLGTRSTSAPEPALRPLLAAHAHHLAWHADLIAARLPELAEVDTDTFTVAPSTTAAAMVEHARAATTTDELITGVYRTLLPQLLTDCRRHLAEIDPRVDGPTARVLTLMTRDLQADLQEIGA